MKASHLGLLLSILLLFLTAVMPGTAQENPTFAELVVHLWPEFDQPGVLVILQATVGDSVSLPTTVSLPLPSSVDEPYVVANAESNGPLVEVPSYEIVKSSNANWVVFETDQPNIWVEFYDEFQSGGDERAYSYEWPGGVEIQDASFEVLQPLGVDQLEVNPPSEALLEDDGQIHHRGQLGSLAAEDQFQIQFTYQSGATIPALTDASEVDRLSGLFVRLWPEFDQQAMLVILEVDLPETVSLPAVVVLPIPARVTEPHAVAFVGEDGQLLNAVFDQSVQGAWRLLSIQAESRQLRVEYYDTLAMDGQQRTYRYTWPGGIDIDQAGFEVLPPEGAQQVSILPAAELGETASGQPDYAQGLDSMAADQMFSIDVSYQGEGTAFERPEGVSGGTPDVNQWLPWVIGGVALVLIGGGGWMLLRTRQPKSKPKKRGSRPSAKVKNAQEGIEASVVFCHVCGARSTTSDRFCRQCGAELRT